MDRLFSLEGRVALVTGAARGLGLEIACAFAAAGATTLVHGRSLASLEPALARCRPLGSVAALAFDIGDAAESDRALAEAIESHGPIDILVNNAGIRHRGQLAITDDEFAAITQANLLAPYRIARRLGDQMRDAGRAGRIINITSVAAFTAAALDPSYAASKAGLTAITRALAQAYGPHGITVNAIAPGPFATEYNAEIAASTAKGDLIREQTFLKRWARPEEIAGAALFLASDAGSFVTGTTIMVDGGYSVAG